MIILSENNFEPLEKISYVKDPENVPDVIFYPEVFNKSFIKEIVDILDSINFKNDFIWITDHPDIVYGNNKQGIPFPFIIERIREDIERITSRSFNACLIHKHHNKNRKFYKTDNKLLGFDFIIPSVYFGTKRKIKFISKHTNITRGMKISDGSLLVERASVEKYWKTELTTTANSEPFYNLSFYNIRHDKESVCINPQKTTTKKKLPVKLRIIYLNNKMRVALARKFRNGLSGIRSIPDGYQCFMKNGVNELSKYINVGKLIGTGDWGNVYSACLTKDYNCNRKFAIKMSRITDEDYKYPYTETSSAWYEIWILKDIIKPLIKNNICPNLPLFIDTFLCRKCDFIFRKGDNTHPCVVTAMEMASGDTRDYLKFGNPSDKELYSALFQIMAGLHAIQMSGQILNNDIKAKNILYYNVKPGGYWHYKIGSDDFYVPNYGKLFVLNDFGVSTLYDPNFQLYPNKNRNTFNLGSRFAINIDETFSPIEAGTEYANKKLQNTKSVNWSTITQGYIQQQSRGATYMIDRKTGQVIISRTVLTPIQKSYLFRKGISTNPKTWGYFEHPYIIPPFEFYNDVQDTLRTFVGGKRTTQKGNHALYPSISKKFQQIVSNYIGLAENAKSRDFSFHTYHVLAGSFIKKFFSITVDYKTKPNGKKISYYDMNKCTQFK
jgi:hypothetical protein